MILELHVNDHWTAITHYSKTAPTTQNTQFGQAATTKLNTELTYEYPFLKVIDLPFRSSMSFSSTPESCKIKMKHVSYLYPHRVNSPIAVFNPNKTIIRTLLPQSIIPFITSRSSYFPASPPKKHLGNLPISGIPHTHIRNSSLNPFVARFGTSSSSNPPKPMGAGVQTCLLFHHSFGFLPFSERQNCCLLHFEDVSEVDCF
jgi:hypothetical protein